MNKALHLRGMRATATAVASMLLLIMAGVARADQATQESGNTNANTLDPVQPSPYGKPAAPPTGHQGEWVIAPIPGYGPSQGFSLAVVGQYIYKPEGQSESTPPTTLGLAGAYTQQDSHIVGAGYRGSLADDNWRFLAGVGSGQYNFDFYGVGSVASKVDVHVPIQQSFDALFIQATRRFAPQVYLGPRLIATKIKMSLGALTPPVAANYASLFSQELSDVALGLRLLLDTRDNSFYPTTGRNTQSRVDWYRRSFGGDFNYQLFDAEYNQYFQHGRKNVIAARIYMRYASGGAPFYALSTFGGTDLRGYDSDRYRDQALLAAQAEWRYTLSHRWAVVAFGGVGNVAPSFSKIGDAGLWSAGAGLRLRIAKDNPVNFRLDWAQGRDGSALYLSVGEAF